MGCPGAAAEWAGESGYGVETAGQTWKERFAARLEPCDGDECKEQRESKADAQGALMGKKWRARRCGVHPEFTTEDENVVIQDFSSRIPVFTPVFDLLHPRVACI